MPSNLAHANPPNNPFPSPRIPGIRKYFQKLKTKLKASSLSASASTKIIKFSNIFKLDGKRKCLIWHTRRVKKR